MKDFAIVIVAFNRLVSLTRLIGALKKAEYYGDNVDLIVSIDFSGKTDVADYAKTVDWPFGEKIIIAHEKNLGLRKHVLLCGELTNKYKNICVLEDDIFVSPAFYGYAKGASEFYASDDDVAGISLYTHLWNYLADAPFLPLEDGYDTFFLQQAMSWGQVWTKHKWDLFVEWYKLNENRELAAPDFPLGMSNWPKSSWLKYHNKYLVEKNKYFVYPKVSLSTNFSDAGTHAIPTNTYQVPLQINPTKHYVYQRSSTSSKYDIFFECTNANVGIPIEELTIDLYGTKVDHKRYWLTMRRENFKVIKKYGLGLRPFELNIIADNEGDDIFLYDCSLPLNQKMMRKNDLKFFLYNVKTSSKKKLLMAGIYLYIMATANKIKKIIHS